MKTKLTAIIVAFCLCLAPLVGCGGGQGSEATPAPESSAEPEVSAAPEATEPAEINGYTADEIRAMYDAAFAAYSPDTVVMHINGAEVTWQDYFTWLCQSVDAMVGYGITDFSAPMNEELDPNYTYGSWVNANAMNYIVPFWVYEYEAAQRGVTLTDENAEVLKAMHENAVNAYGNGDEDEYAKYLEDMYFTVELDNRLNTAMLLVQQIFESMYGVEGADLPDGDVLEYAENNSYMRAKHILFMTVDSETNEPLSDEEKAEKRALAEETLEKLRAAGSGEALETAFDGYMNDLSEDTGLASNPDGYIFTLNEMVEPFETATLALDDYGLSDIVESNYGYHIILRLPMDPDKPVMSQGYSMRAVAANALMQNIMNEWCDSAEITYEPGFENIDINALFGFEPQPAQSEAPEPTE